MSAVTSNRHSAVPGGVEATPTGSTRNPVDALHGSQPKARTVSHGCGRSWTGVGPEHCAVCHETFDSTEAGDAHRVGEHGVTSGSDRRRCLTVVEMEQTPITSGRHAGEPWFKVRVDRHTGERLWSRNRPSRPAWTSAQSDTGALDLDPSNSTSSPVLHLDGSVPTPDHRVVDVEATQA